MALPSNRIWLRSSYLVGLERTDLERIFVELYVYTGTLTTDKPAQPQYTLESTAFINQSTGDKRADVDIAPYVRDFVEIAYSGSFVTNAVWVEYDLYYADNGDTAFTQSGTTVQLTGLYGYGFYEDGKNPTLSETTLLSANFVVVPEGEDATIPVLQDYLTGLYLYEEPDVTLGTGSLTLIDSDTSMTTTENTANVVYYASSKTALGTPTQMLLTFSGGRGGRRIRIIYKPECTHTAIKLTFVNRFGALQDFWCFAASRQSLNVTDTEYKGNVLAGGTYTTTKHQYKTINKNGRGTVQVNTDWYPEKANATVQEMFLSEQIWATIDVSYFSFDEFSRNDGDIVVPVRLTDRSVQYRTHVNDQLINYTFMLEFAADRIQTVS